MSIIFIVIGLLILVNGFFASAEMALVSVSKREVDQLVKKGTKNAMLLKTVTKDSVRYLSTIQVAITFAGFLSSAFAGSHISDHIVAICSDNGLIINNSVAVIIVTFILSYITLVLGELVPKRIAMQYKERIALFSARVIYVFMIVMKPFVSLLSISTNLVLKLLRINQQTHEEKITEKEIKELIVTGHFEGLYQLEEKNMLERIFQFDDVTAEMIMTPRVDSYVLDIDDPISENIDELIESGYSRIPIYENAIDNIIGILLIKDLLKELKDHKIEEINIRSLLRDSYIVFEHIKINVLFSRMKKSKHHLAILVDEYGGFQGLVTMEDILEEIVGNIYDEHDHLYQSIERQNHNTYLVNGKMQIQTINELLHANIPGNSHDYDTLAGYIVNYLGDIPVDGEQEEINIDGLRIKIIEVNDNRIEKVRIILDEKNVEID